MAPKDKQPEEPMASSVATSSSSTQDPYYKEKTIQLLESIATSAIEALNERDFDLRRPGSIWQRHFAKNFRASPDLPIVEAKAKQKASIGMTLEEYLRMMETMIERNCPAHRHEIVDLTTNLDEEAGRGEVFMNTKQDSFVYEGMVVNHVAVLSFVWEERSAKWKCVRFKGLRNFFVGEGLY